MYVCHLYLEVILYSFWCMAITLTTNPLHFLHLACLACRLKSTEYSPVRTGILRVIKNDTHLYILEVHITVLTEVYDRAQKVKQA